MQQRRFVSIIRKWHVCERHSAKMTLAEELGRAAECALSGTDAFVAAFSRNDVPAPDALSFSALRYYNESVSAMDELWVNVFGTAGAAEKTASARAWLEAQFERSLFGRVEAMLRMLHECAAVAASTTVPLTARRHACQIITNAGQTAFMLLSHTSHAACHLATTANRPTDKDLSRRAVQALAHPDFMQAVADASRGMTATTALLRSETGARQLSRPPFDLRLVTKQHVSMASTAAGSVCRYTRIITELLLRRLYDENIGSGAGPPASSIPPDIRAAYEALAGSQLLAASAGAMLDDPGVEEDLRPEFCYEVHHAAVNGCNAVFHMHLLWLKMANAGGHEGRQLAAGLLRALRHREVQRLQVALLDRLAVHAGMSAGLVVEGQGEQQQGGQQGQQACGWEGSSGTWWLAREEERQGKLLGFEEFEDVRNGSCDGGSRSCWSEAGWLESVHVQVLCATLKEWAFVTAQLAGEAGVEARPPPLLAARLAARAAEAVCRLCRGQGLEGAYAPAPEWEVAQAQLLVLTMVPDTPDAGQLPVDTARACLPYWLEAGGWAAALQADAVAAAMGRLPAVQRQRPRSSYIEVQYIQEGSQADLLMRVVTRVSHLAHGSAYQEFPGAYGYLTLPAAAQADVRRRLSRCGLAATLDHAVRLALSTQQEGLTYGSSSSSSSLQQAPHPGFASALAKVVSTAAHVVDSGIVRLLEPAPSAAPAVPGISCSSAACGGAGEESGSGGAGGGRRSGHQLGMLYTLSKGAAVLARELDGLSGAAAGAGSTRGQPGRRQETRARLLDWAARVLIALNMVMECMKPETLQRIGEAHGSEEEEEASGGEDGGDDVAWGWDAVCVDEVQEALALAARAASNLAASLAWALAADLTAATAAAEREGTAAVQLSSEQTTGVAAVCGVLRDAAQWWRRPLLLPPAQLLACQPQRLLAAACALAAVLPPDPLNLKTRLGVWLASTVVVMAAHRTLSGRVRSWMAPGAAATNAAAAAAPVSVDSSVTMVASGDAVVDTCGGCLAAPLQYAVRHTAGVAVGYVVLMLALLKIAAGEVEAKAGVPCCEGGRDATGEVDGGFQQCAAIMAERVARSHDGRGPRDQIEHRQLPDGSFPIDLLDREQQGAGGPPPPLAPPGALPPPLALPPRRQGALPRLRVCGNPRCGNFAERSEGALPLKQCGGCRAVRYCGAECQRAHWREGHRAECKALAAGEGR